MRFLPAVAYYLGVSGAVIVGIIVTGSLLPLWGLSIFAIVGFSYRESSGEEKKQ